MTGPAKQCGFIMQGRGFSAQATFDMASLLKDKYVVTCTYEKQTGKIMVHSEQRRSFAANGHLANDEAIAQGRKLFSDNCAACHSITRDMTGPALQGVEDRHSKQWLYSFTRNSSELIRAKDPEALKVYKEWNGAPMVSYSTLSDKDIDAMLSYIKATGEKESYAAN